jgi:hypothetical protein
MILRPLHAHTIVPRNCCILLDDDYDANDDRSLLPEPTYLLLLDAMQCTACTVHTQNQCAFLFSAAGADLEIVHP